MLEEANGSGVAITDYVYLGDQPIATFTPGSSSLAFIHADRLGTPQKATNSGQGFVWKANYLPFGELNAASSQTATLAQSLRLPGQEFEAETGWHQNGFRDYAPSLGRYLESDPIGMWGGLDSFVYAKSNPIIFYDAAGLDVRIYADSLFGHEAFEVDTSDGVTSFGFGPQGGPTALSFFESVPGHIDEKAGYASTSGKVLIKTIKATNEEGDRLAARLRKLETNPPAYQALAANCQQFACLAASMVSKNGSTLDCEQTVDWDIIWQTRTGELLRWLGY